MNIITATHQLAMDTSALADVSKAKGFTSDALEFYKRAFELEKKAALMTHANDENPTPHFILMRSATALAYKAGLFQDCDEMIERCLDENPPQWIVADLLEIAKLILPANQEPTKKSWEIEGVLTNIFTDESQVTIKDAVLSQSFTLLVPKNLFLKIVKKHWSKKVSVQARQTPNGVMILEEIRAIA
jgi:hypothetical protein